MSKSLNTIQKICKVCKILAEIAFVLLIVGTVLMAACGVFIGTGNLEAMLSSGMVNIDDMLRQSGATQEYITAVFISLAVVMAAEAVVAKFINVYFKHELKAGTPFTFEGAKEMLRLGIITLAVPIGASIVAAIVIAVMSGPADGNGEISINISLGLGLVFLALSPLLRHGTELRLKAQYAEEKLAEEKPADSEEDNL